MDFQLDQSGINSLAGFAYQIKVFAYYAFRLQEGMQVEFETIEDINVKTIVSDQIDEYSHKFVCKVADDGVNKWKGNPFLDKFISNKDLPFKYHLCCHS